MVDRDEVAAAAERVRKCLADGPDAAYPAVRPGEYHEDCAVLAEAWVRYHPADDADQITPGWLAAVGFGPEPTDGYEGGSVNVWVYRDTRGEPHLTLDRNDDEPGQWDVFFGAVEDWNQFPRGVTTRGEVRRLLTALGIGEAV